MMIQLISFIVLIVLNGCPLIILELRPFENIGILNFSAQYPEKYLSYGLETSSAIRRW